VHPTSRPPRAAKEPSQRYASMNELRDAVAAERRRLFSPSSKRWPLVVGGRQLLALEPVWWWRAAGATGRPVSPAPSTSTTCLNEKALSSLRAALRIAPASARQRA
jgi:hypothetical protein